MYTGAYLKILGRGFLTTASGLLISQLSLMGNYKFLPSIGFRKVYGQLVKNFEMKGVSGNPSNPPKPAPGIVVDMVSGW